MGKLCETLENFDNLGSLKLGNYSSYIVNQISVFTFAPGVYFSCLSTCFEASLYLIDRLTSWATFTWQVTNILRAADAYSFLSWVSPGNFRRKISLTPLGGKQGRCRRQDKQDN